MKKKPITGQYEFVHSSGVGLDYFTSRIDHLTLQANGRFLLTIQKRSRLSQAAHSIASGQQPNVNVAEDRREGNYKHQGNELLLFFDNGGFEPGKVAQNGEGVQLGPNFFSKVSDSTLLPPTHRLQKDMNDIAKGLKIASALGGVAAKAVRTFQNTQNTVQTAPGTSSPPPPPAPAAAQTEKPQPPQGYQQAIFCDQCG
ncbi:MAG TPA: hypothetical protein VH593_30710, partial [Ktedonobacteraceae bacterium]